MSIREQKILSNEFFLDKQDLAEQIIQFENEGRGYLPNEPEKQYLIFEVNNSKTILGRVHNYYFFGIYTESSSEWKHLAFPTKSKCMEFFLNNYEQMKQLTDDSEHIAIDKQKAFWLNQIERVS